MARIDAGAAKDSPEQTNAVVGTNGIAFDPYFIQTEFERITSEALLRQALGELRQLPEFAEHTKISPEMDAADGVARLRKLIDLRQSRSTSLVEIRAHTSDPQISADVANKVAEVYMRH